MLEQVTAVRFDRRMGSGKTWPCLLSCLKADGEEVEVIAKFSVGPERQVGGLIAEAIAAMLAADLDLPVPEPLLVEFDTEFVELIKLRDADLANRASRSVPVAFGSSKLPPGFTSLPRDKGIPQTLRAQAAEIFAFDALIQNPDRRISNPNLWAKSERIGVYDHEQAFSFLALPIIGGSPGPWAAARHPEAFRFLEQHVFYASLRGGRLDLGPFQQKLSSLTEERLRASLAAVPLEWLSKSDFHLRVFSYLMEARQQGEDMVHFLQHVLR